MVDNEKYTFQQCLIMTDNVIKLDLVYIMDGIFTDINILYNFHIVSKHRHYKKVKQNSNKDIISNINNNIKELVKNQEYFKAIKRYFSLYLLEKKMKKSIIDLLNSQYGRFFKFIHSLNLCFIMLNEKFKPIELNIIRNNLEYYKQYASNITILNIDNILNRLIDIIKLNKKTMIIKLEELIKDCQSLLNESVKEYIKS